MSNVSIYTCSHYPVIFTIHGKTYISPVKDRGWVEVPAGTRLEDLQIDAPDYNTVVEEAPRTFFVKGSKGDTYTVTVTNKHQRSCTCPGFKYRGKCKHLDVIPYA